MNDQTDNDTCYTGTEKISPLWNLNEDFSVAHAAALVADYDPRRIDSCKTDPSFEDRFPNYFIALDALTKAITNKRLPATIRYSAREYGYAQMSDEIHLAECTDSQYEPGISADDEEELAPNHSCIYKPFPDWTLSTVARNDLIEWLTQRDFRTGFFFPTAADGPGYLDPRNPHYSPKLAAAIRAWETVTSDPKYLNNGKHTKQNLESWLTAHAAEYDLVKEDGEINASAISDQIAKVANWQEKGGAPRTPGN